ncbi:hypothetical protein PV327_009370 [Microctonus hyperodae]|uniref:Non-structural maintenance of chromosomes element 4 n=1 Tax=Microctonus hyperodae TaxID=165561 RepID=A0AA39FTN5_MICHY|nr:hypothetical protein PV327_009370 [Microctonus hyperodae]
MSTSNSSQLTHDSQSSRRSIFQSPNERKKALRTILTRTQTLQQNGDPRALYTLQDVFKEADDIHDDATLSEKVSNQDQIVMDSEVMTVSSMVIKTCTQHLTKECSAFDKNDFIEKLLTYVENLPDTTLAEPNWAILENEIPHFNSTANYTCLLDWMNLSEQPIVVKEKKERRANVQRDTQATIQRPENVVQLEEEEKAIEKTVQQIRKLIVRLYKSNSTPIDFFQLILDPSDFGKTIENLLHVSFLIRDGHIKLNIDDEGSPMITPSTKEMSNHAREMGENGKIQNIITLDIEQWRTLKNAYRLTTPMIDF